MWIILITLLIIIAVILLYRINQSCYIRVDSEHFTAHDTNYVADNVYVGPDDRESKPFVSSFHEIAKINAQNNIDAQLFDDITFRDVTVYENDIDGRTGLDKCLDNLAGHCVEYGVSGVAYYYPPEKTNQYYGEMYAQDKEDADAELLFPAF